MSQHDPELHLLRTIGRSLGVGREAHDWEAARRGLWQALEAEDAALAGRWLAALRAAAATLPADRPELLALATEALDRIAHAS